jgi:hypothetical protein
LHTNKARCVFNADKSVLVSNSSSRIWESIMIGTSLGDDLCALGGDHDWANTLAENWLVGDIPRSHKVFGLLVSRIPGRLPLQNALRGGGISNHLRTKKFSDMVGKMRRLMEGGYTCVLTQLIVRALSPLAGSRERESERCQTTGRWKLNLTTSDLVPPTCHCSVGEDLRLYKILPVQAGGILPI